MCVALLVPKNTEVTREKLLNCYVTNPDGFGFSYFDENGQLIIRKFIGQDNILLGIEEFLLTRQHYMHKQFLAHFRIASHGRISKRTCHPFKINNEMVFCHNGILSDYSKQLSLDSKISDTMLFNRKVLQKLPADFMNSPLYKKMLEETIGTWNKMIIIRADGQHWILNEEQGEWSDGVWYSNSSYKDYDYSYCGSNYSIEKVHEPLYKRAYTWCKNLISILPDVYEYGKALMEEME